MSVRQDISPDLWDKCIRALLEIRNYQDDWDGEGSKAPAAPNVDTAIIWARYMQETAPWTPPPQVVPGTGGEVILAWKDSERYLEAEIPRPGRFEWMCKPKGQRAVFCINDGKIPLLMEWAAAR
jgi:hypothetical protein